jgi:hypothetical protein
MGMGMGGFLKKGLGRVVVGKTGGEVNGMLPGERSFWLRTDNPSRSCRISR